MSTKRSCDSIKLINFRNSDNRLTPVDDHVIQKLQEIVTKFSFSIRRLEVASSSFREIEMMSLLNVLKSLEQITFYDIELVGNEAEENLQLEHLKEFNFHLCNVKIPNLVLKLPSNVLSSLTIENSILKKEQLREIFEQQRDIHRLYFDPYYVDPASMEHLRLQEMKLRCNRNVSAILSNQHENLTSLDLSRAHIGDNEFLETCKLSKLRSLKLWIDRVSWEILGNIESLKELSELSINYGRLEVKYMRTLCRIKLPNLKGLKVIFPRLKILPDNFIELSRSMPQLRYLNISNQSIGVLGVLIETFKNLETLIIGCDSDSSEVVEFPINDVQNQKLKELCIYSTFGNQKVLKCSQSILEIFSKLVKLEKLKLSNIISLKSQHVRDILADHESFTHLLVESYNENDFSFDEGFLQVLKDKGAKLKYFHMRVIEISVHKKKLERAFRHQFSYVTIRPRKSQICLRDCKWEHGGD